ncbi:MAG: hypothetical protein KDA61_21305, partial [Planctomycetales bacterium]|nr:hypothetical protein [Planctomycetales bacterium]
DLEALVLKCLEKRPDDRLESSLELVEELRRFEAGQPLHSRPISLVDQAARWSRRNPKPLAAFSLILLTTFFGAWSWGMRVAENEASRATVRSLQLGAESMRVQRRFLLLDLAKSEHLWDVPFLPADLETFEAILRNSDDVVERRTCLRVLLNNGRFDIERFRDDKILLADVVDLLKDVESRETNPTRRELITRQSERAERFRELNYAAP